MTAKKDTNRLKPIKHRIHGHVRKQLVPHKGNQFRPFLIRRSGILAVLLLMLSVHAGYIYSQTGSVLGKVAEVNTAELETYTNQERTQDNKLPLDRSTTLDVAAAMKAEHMIENEYWAHVAPDGTEPWHWLKESGYTYAVAGENLAKNFGSAQATVQAWMDSESHRNNLLDPRYEEVGFAVRSGEMNDEDVTIVVAIYGAPQEATVAGVEIAAPITAPLGGGMAPISRLGIALQAINPATLASLVLTVFVGMVALLAHAYRAELPKNLRKSWYRNHGVIKASFMTIVLISTLYLYGGGQL